MSHQAEGREWLRADVSDIYSVALPGLVLNQPCPGIAFGAFDDKEAKPAAAPHERPYDLPTGSVTREEQ